MQVLITHGRMARTRVMQLSAAQLVLASVTAAAVLMGLSGAIYHYVFLKAVHEGWPVVGPLVQWVVRDELAARERFMRENLDAMAQKVGEMQAKLVRLEAMSERVSGLAGVKPQELGAERPSAAALGGGQGGPYVAAPRPSLNELQRVLSGLDEVADWQDDVLAYSESRLFQERLDALRVPSAPPVQGRVGSGFGVRSDPFSGRRALHTGLDFPSEAGTPIHASAGGVVITAGWHADYGNMVELDHGKGLVTRYAHSRALHVKPGQIVKQGERIAEVGTTGRSTGPHLHFEVLIDGVRQDPARFLAGGAARATTARLDASSRTRR